MIVAVTFSWTVAISAFVGTLAAIILLAIVRPLLRRL